MLKRRLQGELAIQVPCALPEAAVVNSSAAWIEAEAWAGVTPLASRTDDEMTP